MDKPKAKMGRPPKPPDEAKGRVYQIRLTDAELESYQMAAARKGVATAAWMRGWLNKAVKRESKRD